jgi:pimeloyl-ACP methyl ester carboxylesterase
MAEPMRVLFVHGGPGLNAGLERQLLGNSLPVHWWDQPLVGEKDTAPWERLLDATVREVERMADEAMRPIALLASSFGSHLARAVLGRVPNRVSHVTIVGGILDIRTAFARLAARVAQANSDPDLSAAGVQAAEDTDPASLWALVGRIFSVPNVLDFYWSPAASAQCDAMKALAACGALLHMPTFEGVLRDFLAREDHPLPRSWAGSTRIICGRHDPYASESDIDEWRRIFTSPQFEWVEAAHFPHLELPPETWVPRA